MNGAIAERSGLESGVTVTVTIAQHPEGADSQKKALSAERRIGREGIPCACVGDGLRLRGRRGVSRWAGAARQRRGGVTRSILISRSEAR